jgi:hypothetical protein
MAQQFLCECLESGGYVANESLSVCESGKAACALYTADASLSAAPLMISLLLLFVLLGLVLPAVVACSPSLRQRLARFYQQRNFRGL